MPLIVARNNLASFFLSNAIVPWETSVVLNIDQSPVSGADVKVGYSLDDVHDKTTNIALNFCGKRYAWFCSGVSYARRLWRLFHTSYSNTAQLWLS